MAIFDVQVIVPDPSITGRNTYKADVFQGVFNTESGYVVIIPTGPIKYTETDFLEVVMVMPSGTHVPMQYDPNDVVYRIKEES